jgi:hypothetical protein
MSEENGEEETIWEVEDNEFETEKANPDMDKLKNPKKYPYQKKYPSEEEMEKTDLQKTWRSLVKSLEDITDPMQMTVLTACLRAGVQKLKEGKYPEKYPYEEKKALSPTELIHKGLSKLSYQELMEGGCPPELLTKRFIASYEFSPVAEQMLKYVKAGEQIPSQLLRKADVRDLAAFEKLIKEEQSRTIRKSDIASLPQGALAKFSMPELEQIKKEGGNDAQWIAREITRRAKSRGWTP